MTGKSDVIKSFAELNNLPLIDLKLSEPDGIDRWWASINEVAQPVLPIIQAEPRPIRKELCFRMETPDGMGMYQTDYREHLNRDSVIENCYRHPTPYDDYALGWAALSDKDEYFFGFASLEQLRRWIHSERLINALKDHDLAVSIYQTDDFSIGDTQMVFRKSTAVKVGRFDL